MDTFKRPIWLLAFVQGVLGFVWLQAGWEKITDAGYLSGMGKTLAAFASKNPYGWYHDFLVNLAAPNATLFGVTVEVGEVLVGLGLLATAVMAVLPLRHALALTGSILGTIAFAGGALMSINFWLAAGWMSLSTAGENLVMALIQLGFLAAALIGLVQQARTEREETVVSGLAITAATKA